MFAKKNHKIAIIGMACRFPQSDGVEAFWQNLIENHCMITEVPSGRWDSHQLQMNGEASSLWGGFIEGIDTFDADFFNISPKEAVLMDPQQRIALEIAWQVIEHAGYLPSDFENSLTGVFSAATLADYFELQRTSGAEIGAYTYGGFVHAIISNRISYWLGLKGPSFSVDSACGSSFSALNAALTSIEAGQCNQAMVIAANALLSPTIYESLGKARVISMGERCYTFTNKAKGFIRGEGVGALLLKPYSQAIKDNDHIYGVIESFSEQHSGRSRSMPTPDADVQASVIQAALKRAGRAPKEVDYVECHGTSTPMGDTVELKGLQKVFSNRGSDCQLGTLKTSIGHLESAAGLASIIKVLLCLDHEYIPQNYSESNPADFHPLDEGLHYLHQPFAWPSNGKRLAGVSVYGYGGANAHCLVHEHKQRACKIKPEAQVFIFSAKKRVSLLAYLKNFITFLEQRSTQENEALFLQRVAMTLQLGREAFEHRIALVADSLEQLKQQLQQCLSEQVIDPKVQMFSESDIAQACRQKKLSVLATAWSSGAQVPWHTLKRSKKLTRIGLPVYAFDRKRYWFESPAASTQNMRIYTKQWKPVTQVARLAPYQNIVVMAAPRAPIVRAVEACFERAKIIIVSGPVFEVPDLQAVDLVVDGIDLQNPDFALDERLSFIQRLLKAQKRSTRMLHVYHDAAVLAGFSEMLAAEYQQLLITGVSVDATAHLEDVLTQELSQSSFAAAVRYQQEQRLSPSLQACILPQASPETSCALGQYAIDSDALYIVTGGTGALGQVVLRALYDKGARHFLVCSKGALPPPDQWQQLAQQEVRLAALAHLKILGANVETYSGSIDADFVTTANTAVSACRRLGGVIHCAGMPTQGSASFLKKTAEDFACVLPPKVESLQCLGAFVQAWAPDFFVVYSSVSSFLPHLSVGVSDYAAANAYMNQFIPRLNSQLSETGCWSICWPNWSEAGMGVKASDKYHAVGLCSLSNKQGLALLDQVLQLPKPGVYFPCVIDPMCWSEKEALNSAVMMDQPVKESVMTNKVKREPSGQSDIMPGLLKLFCQELQISAAEVDIEKDFAAYGVDSILLADLVQRLEKAYQLPLSAAVLLAHPSLSQLAAYLSAHMVVESQVEPSVLPTIEPSIANVPEQLKRVPDAIAVIGMDCHFPRANGLEAFWQMLKTGASGVGEVPSTRWSIESLYQQTAAAGKTTSKWGGFIDEIEYFDPGYFKLTDEAATQLDPTVRLFMQTAVQTFQHAGYSPEDIWGRKVGVVVGGRMTNYMERFPAFNAAAVTGFNQNFIAAYLAQHLNLKGACMVVDTACSSSLVSLHLACQQLRAGEVDMALAGGVYVLLDEAPFILLSQSQTLSKDGHCYCFDERANGLVPGEGCASVLLKRLDDALADGDQIYAVVNGSAVNNDGFTMGLTTPSVDAQADVIHSALDAANLSPDLISYVEAHGTGTRIGDPIELKALDTVFSSRASRKQYCAIGSVKTNLGHQMLCAGIAGAMKTMLSLHHKIIPPTLNCEHPNPRLNFEKTAFYPALQAHNWSGIGGKHFAGVSSFGFGGTNAHLVLSDLASIYDAPYQATRRPLGRISFNKKYIWQPKQGSTTCGLMQFEEVEYA